MFLHLSVILLTGGGMHVTWPTMHAPPKATTHAPPAATHAPPPAATHAPTPPPPGSHARPPWQPCRPPRQPRTSPPGSHARPPGSHARPPGSHACPPWQPRMPPLASHACPPPIQEIYIFTAETHFLHIFLIFIWTNVNKCASYLNLGTYQCSMVPEAG